MDNLKKGKVKWFDKDKGYGFINIDGMDDDIFVHYSQVLIKGYKELYLGDEVKFELINTPHGYQAIHVKRTKCNLVNLLNAKKMASNK